MFSRQKLEGACTALEARLEDYLEGRLEPREASEVEIHAKSCARCAAALETARAAAPLVGVLAAQSTAAPGPYFVPRVMASIRGEEREREVWKPVERAAWRLCWLAAAAVLILAAVMFHIERTGTVLPGPQQSQIQALVNVPIPQPASQDDTFLLVATDDNGR